MLLTGVYRIRNIKNGKLYIGSAAINIDKRWSTHYVQLRGDYHPIKQLLIRGYKQIDIAKIFHVDPSTISDIKRNKTWRGLK